MLGNHGEKQGIMQIVPIVGTGISPMANMGYLNRRCWLEDCGRIAVKLAARVDEGFADMSFYSGIERFALSGLFCAGRAKCSMRDTGILLLFRAQFDLEETWLE